MIAAQSIVLVLVCAGALIVVLTRDVFKQTIVLSLYGFVLTILFFLFQAPDVALSQLAVGAVALPLAILIAIAKVRRQEK